MTVGIVRHGIYLEHINDEDHPEGPHRLERVYAVLEEMGNDGLVYVAPRMATHDEIALIHERSYIDIVAGTKGRARTRLDPDTATSAKSYEAACMAVGGMLELVDSVERGEADSGFALVRPPGHHAERSRAMGFCIFNNIAVGARYLQTKYGYTRILIADFDLHHGNGTQHSFYRDPEVLYFSIHQYPYYPGTGSVREIGDGEGSGYTVNVPLSYGAGDDDYEYAFRRLLVPLAEKYRPEIVLVSAGFDTYFNDPLGGMSVTERGYGTMTRILADIALEHCKGKVVCALEGGYDVTGLASSVKAVIMELKGASARDPQEDPGGSKEIVEVVNKARDLLTPYWGDL